MRIDADVHCAINCIDELIPYLPVVWQRYVKESGPLDEMVERSLVSIRTGKELSRQTPYRGTRTVRPRLPSGVCVGGRDGDVEGRGFENFVRGGIGN